MSNPLPEFSFGIISGDEPYPYKLTTFEPRLNKLREDFPNCKITMQILNPKEMEKDILNIPKLDMVSCDLFHVSYLPKLIEKFKIKWVHCRFTGNEYFLKVKELIDNPNIFLSNSKGAYQEPLSDYAIMAMLYFNYNVNNYVKSFENHKWTKFTNSMLKGKTLVIYGYGDIGIGIAKKAKIAFGMNVIGIVKTNKENRKGMEYVDEIFTVDKVKEETLKKAHFVLSVLPETKENNDIFNMDFFKKMNEKGVFINIGRGNTVVEDELYEALNKNVIRGAVIDVFKDEPLKKESKLYLLKPDKILMTNHTAGFVDDWLERNHQCLIENIRHYISTGKPYGLVDKVLGY